MYIHPRFRWIHELAAWLWRAILRLLRGDKPSGLP